MVRRGSERLGKLLLLIHYGRPLGSDGVSRHGEVVRLQNMVDKRDLAWTVQVNEEDVCRYVNPA